MTENTENTLSAYLGPQFQLRLMWQLLVEPEFAEKIIQDLAIEYFDDPNIKRLFYVMLEYFNEFDKVPNLQNQSIHQAINKYKNPNNIIEEESLFGVVKRITLWNERIINKQMLYDGDVVQKSAYSFIKQQEYRKSAEDIQTKVKSGELKNKYVIAAIEERFQKIAHIGEENDDSESITEGINKALRKEFRETIPTGIGVIDSLTGGGLGKGEIGVMLAPSGVGKTTALTIIANTAYEQEKNVAQIIFEDTKDQVKRKHYTIWAESALSKLNEDEENERVNKIVHEKAKELEGKGRLVIKKFSQEDTTMKDIRNWMTNYEKKWGFKFDLLALDYLDCVESHKRSVDRNENELTVIKGFEALSSDFNIPCWTAIQSNRSGFGSEFVEAHQTGGSIKRIQKAHFFMSIAKTPAQQEANFANIRIIKARFAKDGQTFEDCIFNNDTVEIIIDDPKYPFTKTYKNLKHHDEGDVEKLENSANKLSATTKMHIAINQHEEGTSIDELKSNDINGLLRNNAVSEELEPNKDFHLDKKDNNSVTEETLELNGSNEETLELNGDVNEAPSENVSNGMHTLNDITTGGESGAKDNDFEWTGETSNIVTNEEKVSINESPPEEKNKEINLDENILIDPDKPQGENKTVSDMLVKKREYQHVIKK
ncbi:MAG: hypothetical protein PF487_00220 [Bacteroidales bacterium]|jgi:replicative DNA helicase|nr:hypothetical protein [Bacteroidales bacterium]